LNVVAANPKEWNRSTVWKEKSKDGCVYGRGAYDMKCMTAIEIMVLKLSKKK